MSGNTTDKIQPMPTLDHSRTATRSTKPVPSPIATNAGKRESASVNNRTSQVIKQLTELILDGDLKRDQLLPPERELALQLGVSRTILREATKFLHSDGLVTIKHGVGIVVNGASSEPVQRAMTQALHRQADPISKLYEVRCSLEAEIVALAARRAHPRNLEKLRALCVTMDAHLADRDLPRLWELDIEFHSALAEATQNEVFVVVLEAATKLLIPAVQQTKLTGRSYEETQRLHWLIFEAVKAGDSDAAMRFMREHLKIPEL